MFAWKQLREIFFFTGGKQNMNKLFPSIPQFETKKGWKRNNFVTIITRLSLQQVVLFQRTFVKQLCNNLTKNLQPFFVSNVKSKGDTN